MKTTRTLLLAAALLLALSASACKDDAAKKEGETPEATHAQSATDGDNTNEGEDAEAAADEKDEGEPGAEGDAEGGEVEAAEGGGKWLKSTTYGVKFRIPEDWQVTIEKDGVSATDAEETTTAVLVGSKSHGMVQAAIQDVQEKVKLKDVQIQDTKQTVLNGFPGQHVRGAAVLERESEGGIDQEIQFIAYNLKISEDTVVTMMIFSEAEWYEAKRETIEGLAKTLTKTDKN